MALNIQKVNTITASVTEIPAYALSGVAYFYLGHRFTLMSCFIISILGGISLVIWSDVLSAIPVMILAARFGVSATFHVCYLGNA